LYFRKIRNIMCFEFCESTKFRIFRLSQGLRHQAIFDIFVSSNHRQWFCSNSFKFWQIELWIPNLNVKFGRLWHIRPNLIEFDLKISGIKPNSTIVSPTYGQIRLIYWVRTFKYFWYKFYHINHLWTLKIRAYFLVLRCHSKNKC
jgi:hypothetical protein